MNSNTTVKIREFRHALRHLERFITANVKDNAVCCGVTATQCHVLLKVEEAGLISLSGLSEYLGLDKSSLSRTVDGLVRLSLLQRKESSEDRRYHSIGLTERGKRFVDRLNKECDAYYQPIYEALPTELRERILEDMEALFTIFSRTTKNTPERTCCRVEDVIND
jgi:DNA-binding MarR family transcriptional regulator